MPPSELLFVFVFVFIFLFVFCIFFVLAFCICICILFLFVFYLYSYLFLYYYWGDRACEASSASISALIDSFVERKTTSVLLLPVQISSFQYIMYIQHILPSSLPRLELTMALRMLNWRSTNKPTDTPPPPPLQTRTFNKYTYTNIHTCKNVHTNLSRWISNIFRP